MTHQEVNQVAAALRVFQGVRETSGNYKVRVPGACGCETVHLAEMDHFEDTAQLTDDEIEALIDRLYSTVEDAN